MTQPDLSPVLSVEELDDLVPVVLLMEAWTASVRELILKSLEAGATFQNACLEPKRGTRKWDVEEALVRRAIREALLGLGKNSDDDVIAPRATLSPSAAEKLVGKANFKALLATLVTSDSSGYNLKLTIQKD